MNVISESPFFGAAPTDGPTDDTQTDLAWVNDTLLHKHKHSTQHGQTCGQTHRPGRGTSAPDSAGPADAACRPAQAEGVHRVTVTSVPLEPDSRSYRTRGHSPHLVPRLSPLVLSRSRRRTLFPGSLRCGVPPVACPRAASRAQSGGRTKGREGALPGGAQQSCPF